MPAETTTPDKRRQIVDTAYALFKRDGYHATGIDRIIAEAGVAKMTMYRHFPSKDGLIVAVLDLRTARFEAQLDRLAATAAGPAAKLVTILDWYRRWFDGRDFHGCLFAHALAEFGAPDSTIFAAVATHKRGFKARLVALFAEALPTAAAETAGGLLFMMLEGATLLAQMGQGGPAIEQIRGQLAALLAGPETRL